MFVVNPVTVLRGLRARFVKAFGNAEDPSEIKPYLMETESDGPDEEYGWLGQSPELSEWVDERKVKSLNDFKYSIANKDYEGTLGVDRNAIMDDRLGATNIRIDDLARKAKIHPRKVFFQLLVDGTAGLCYDGLPFFSASHTEGQSGTQSNLISGTGTTLAQLKADIENVVAKMKRLKDDVGNIYNDGEIQIGVICPPELESAFKDLNSLEMISNTSNAMKGKIKSIVASGRLTDVNDWYFADVTPGLKPVVQQNRKAPEFNGLEGDSENGFMRKKWLYGIDYRMGMGYGLWQKMFKITN